VTKAAGVPWLTPHVLRHSLATTLADQGHPTEDIAVILGHTDAAFTARTYIHSERVPRFDSIEGAS
jgi:integrase